MFDWVKKLPAHVLRQNITNAGGPEASRYLLDLCARCRHGLGLLKTKPTLGSLQPSWNLLDLKKQYTCSINEGILQAQTDNLDAAGILFFHRDNKCMHLFKKIWRTGNSNDGCLCYPSNKNQVSKNSFRNKWFSFISMSTPGMMVGSKCQVHTERSITTIPNCGR